MAPYVLAPQQTGQSLFRSRRCRRRPRQQKMAELDVRTLGDGVFIASTRIASN